MILVSEAGPEHFDFVLYASLKNEFLEAGRIVKKEVGLHWTMLKAASGRTF